MQQMFHGGKHITLTRGELVDTGGFAYYVVSGLVAIYTNGVNGSKLLFGYKAGEVFPFEQINHNPASGRAYTYRAFGNSELIQLPYDMFHARSIQPEFAAAYIEAAQNIIQHQMERIDNLQEEHVLYRLLERLLYMSSRFGTRRKDSVTFNIPISHVDLATSINTTRETVNRHMKMLEKQGVINLRKQMIRINSFTALKAMLEDQNTTDTHSKTQPLSTITLGVSATAS